MPASSRPLAVAALLAATSAWGSLFLVSQPVLAHVDPVWSTMVRYTVAGLALVALLAARGRLRRPLPRAEVVQLALLGWVGYFFFSVLLLVGLKHSVPSHAAVLIATTPISTQLARWALEGQRPSPVSLVSALLALAGVAGVSGALGSDAGGPSTLAGDLTVFAGTLGWVAYTRGSARFPALDALDYSALTAITAWPLMLLSALAVTLLGGASAPTAEGLSSTWLPLLYIGLVPSLVGVIGFNFGVRALGPLTATAFLNFVPVSAMLMSAALGHPPALHELLGSATVVAALLLHTLGQRSAAATGAAAAQTVKRISPMPSKATRTA